MSDNKMDLPIVIKTITMTITQGDQLTILCKVDAQVDHTAKGVESRYSTKVEFTFYMDHLNDQRFMDYVKKRIMTMSTTDGHIVEKPKDTTYDLHNDH